MNRLIWFFLLLLTINIARPLIVDLAGAEAGTLSTVANIAGILWLFVMLRESQRDQMRPFARLLVGYLWIWVAVMLFLGIFIYGWVRHAVAYDLASWFLFMCGIALGCDRRFYSGFLQGLVAFLPLHLGLIVVAITLDIREFAGDLVQGERMAREFVSYRMVWLLYGLPLVLFSLEAVRPSSRILAGCAFLLLFFCSILFQKRFEVVFLLVCLGAVWWHYAMPGSQLPLQARMVAKKWLRQVVGSGLAASVAAYVIMPGVMNAQVEALVKRFNYSGADDQQGVSLVNVVFTNNERFVILGEAVSDFTPAEWMHGRGFGGAVRFDSLILSQYLANGAEESIEALVIPETATFGRRAIEVGLAMPLIKGGLPAFLLVVGLFACAWVGFKDAPPGHRRVGRILLGLFFFRYFQAGAFILTDAIQFMLCALLIGRGLVRVAPVPKLAESIANKTDPEPELVVGR